MNTNAGSDPLAMPTQVAGEVRQRAAEGALLVGIRGIAARAAGLLGSVVLARTLSSSEFGLFAFGALLMTSVSYLTQAGVGAGLIRKDSPPSRAELSVVVAVNLGLVAVITLAAAACAPLLGPEGLVVAAMTAPLLLTAFRAPGLIGLERELLYRPIAKVEIAETVSFYLVAVVAVVIVGIWGLVVAAFLRCALGTAIMLSSGPYGLIAPRLSRRTLRPLLGFGARFQGVALANFCRDQGVLVGISAVAGLPTLGVYTVASRLLQIPQLLFESLFRVSFPAMTRLIATGDHARRLIERGIRLVGLGAGLTLVPLVAVAPAAVPVLFGPQWQSAATIIPCAGLGLMIGGPVAVATAGYLYAIGDAGTVLRSAVLHALAWFIVALPLYPLLGVFSLGLGILASSGVEAAMLGTQAARRSGASIVRPLLPSLVASVVSAVPVLVVVSASSHTVIVIVIGAISAEAIYLGFLRFADAATVRDLGGLIRASVRQPRLDIAGGSG
ncbi:MAG: oligosaccharide flippase family protein [Actinomycetota bacterium]|nr:oligosaccharide flippase family protein [Actinomycetota bacterium]